MRKLPNIHPGEVLLQEFLVPMGISQNALARSIGVPPRRINEIVLGKRAITADTAVRLAHYFGTSEQFWMALQASFDLEEARKKLGRRLKHLDRAACSPARSPPSPNRWTSVAASSRVRAGRCGRGSVSAW